MESSPTFRCRRCGACCRWEGHVLLTDADIAGLAAERSMSERAFVDRYTRLAANRAQLRLAENADGSCVFLDGSSCAVYAARPAQCRAFPIAWRVDGCPASRRIAVLAAMALAAASAALGQEPPRAARLQDPALRECSGLVASPAQPGVYWAHNDSGNAPELFALDREGRALGRWRVDAPNRDWEDLAAGPDGLYIGDVGNNGRTRTVVQVHAVAEPRADVPPGTNALPVRRTWSLTYPEAPFDCEGLFVTAGGGYLVEKTAGPAPGLFRFALDGAPTQRLERVATVPLETAITGADFDAARGRLALVHAAGVCVYETGPDPAQVGRARASEIVSIDSAREAIAFAPGGVLTASERRTLRFWSDADLAAGARETPEAPRIVLPRARGAADLDGDLSEWTDRERLDAREASGGVGGAAFWAAWSEGGVYVAGSIPDGSLSPLRGAWFGGDCVEFFLGRERPGRGGAYGAGDDRCYLAFVPDAAGALKAAIFWPRRPAEPRPGAACAAAADAGGYRFEAFVPWPAGPPAPAPGEAIRFACSALSAVPRRNWYVGASNADGVWATPLLWAVAELSEEPAGGRGSE
jgi:Fe-S-cluster containining protein